MAGTEIAAYEGAAVVNFEDYAMDVGSLVKQVALIQNVMSRVMREDEHFGKIPGTQKPTLLKPGAEKLCMVFRLEPDYEIIREFREDTFIAYTVKCTLTHIPTGQKIASGVGSCNSREAKYRYRSEATDREVPKAYWDSRDPALLGGPNCVPRKKDGKWMVYEQVENDNPWDLDNTIMKMACKRALVAATLNATAASDIFTQDIEDMPAGTVGTDSKPQASKGKPPVKQPEAKKEAPPAPTNGEARKKLVAELEAYCGGDLTMMEDVIAEVSWFESGGKEYRFTIDDLAATKSDGSPKVSDKWVGKALGKLRELTGKE